MNWIPDSFRRRKLFDELSEEMRLHLEERVEHLIGQGLSPIEAQRQTRIAFGNLAMLEERGREIWLWPTLESMWADIRLATRQLRKSPGFAVTAVLTLAMAIGANAVVFGVMNGLILRPLNVPESQSLYSIERAGDSDTSQSYPDYLDIRERNRSFVDLAAYAVSQVGLDAGHGPVTTWGLEATGSYFDSLRIHPYLGRFFHTSDEHGPNSAPFMVLSYAYWHSQFQDDRGMIGRIVLVNKHPFTIIGVAPPTFRGTLVFYSPNFFVPEVNKEQVEGVNDLSDRGTRGLLQVLILLAACANLGGLFAARVADRSRELALRLALGSKRTRILRSLFTEALLISLLGGAAGVAGSVAMLRWLSDWQPFGNFPMHTPVTPDASVYSVALLVTLLSGCLFGAVPIAQVLRTSPYEVVKAGLAARPLKRFSARDVLLVVQISLCAVLVTSSLVALRGLIRSLHGPFGFDPNHSMLVDLRMVGLSGDLESPTQRRMLDAVEAIPGVDSAALTDALLLSDTNATNVFTDTTTNLSASHVAAAPYTFRVSPAYLQTEGTVLVAGRSFTKSDDKNSPRVAIVNREFARKLFGSEIAAIGRHFKMPDGTRVEVVGTNDAGS